MIDHRVEEAVGNLEQQGNEVERGDNSSTPVGEMKPERIRVTAVEVDADLVARYVMRVVSMHADGKRPWDGEKVDVTKIERQRLEADVDPVLSRRAMVGYEITFADVNWVLDMGDPRRKDCVTWR